MGLHPNTVDLQWVGGRSCPAFVAFPHMGSGPLKDSGLTLLCGCCLSLNLRTAVEACDAALLFMKSFI